MTENDALVPPEEWCDHHYEWADDAGRCHHPDCTVRGRQVYVSTDGGTDVK